MKYFVLTAQNHRLFITRFHKMLRLKGSIKEWSEYTGAKDRFNTAKLYSKRKGLLPVVRTVDTYILPDSITHDWRISRDGNGLVMSITGGTFFFIKFGTKIFSCSQFIKFKDTLWNDKTGGMTTHFVPCGNIKMAVSSTMEREDYERFYENQYFNEYK